MTEPVTKNSGGSSFGSFLDTYFHITERKSSIRTEVIAGATTFMTMAYIVLVNPSILSNAGMDFKAVFVATCLAAALSTFLMGIVGRYPFALAAGLGLNGVVAFGLVIGMHVSWQIAMGLIFIEGLVILVLVLTNLRELVMNSIPNSLKISIGVGIGLFIAFIGFRLSGIIVGDPIDLVKFGNIANPVLIMAVIGLIIIMILMALKVKGSILFGIIATAILGIIICLGADAAGIAFNVYENSNLPNTIGAALPAGMSNLPSWGGSIIEIPSAATLSTIGQLDILGALSLAFVPTIFALMMVDFFDTMGTVVAVGGQAGLLDKEGKLPGLKNVLAVDSLAAMIGGFMGCSSNTTYIESASGVSEGGRTGLTAVVVAILFLVAMLLVPLAYLIPSAATAPALIIVGFLMITMIKDLPWDKLEEALPAFLTIASMAFTESISKGIGFGFIAYCLIKLATGKWREVHPLMWLLSIIFAVYFIFVANIV